jgi:hypothetical protein
VMEATSPDPSSRRPIWDLVIDHVEQRGVLLGPAARVSAVLADMRVRAAERLEKRIIDRPLFEGRCCPAHVRSDNYHSEGCPTREGRGYLERAYEKALDFVGFLAAELEAHGVSIDDPIDVRAPASALLVHVQAMLWDHVRTVVQLRSLIEERVS